MVYQVDIPIERVELNIECTHHPELIEKLQEIQLLSDDNSFETKPLLCLAAVPL